jgi:hypothetical protein
MLITLIACGIQGQGGWDIWWLYKMFFGQSDNVRITYTRGISINLETENLQKKVSSQMTIRTITTIARKAWRTW